MQTDTGMTRDFAYVFHVGLDARDVLVLESLFGAEPALNERYRFTSPPAGVSPEILFVNRDSSDAMAHWQAFLASAPQTQAIFVSNNAAGDERELARPLALRNTLPVLTAITATEVGHHSPNQEPMSSGDLRVLVVDDSYPARLYLKGRLQALVGSTFKLFIDYADSGEKAVEASFANEYDLVFLDVNLPGIDGYETCSRIKTMHPSVRIAMLTGRSRHEDMQQGKTSGCDYYITKPPHDTELRMALRLTSVRKVAATITGKRA